MANNSTATGIDELDLNDALDEGYDPLADTLNPPGSVFCSHGAGFYVAWDHVREWAHCEVE